MKNILRRKGTEENGWIKRRREERRQWGKEEDYRGKLRKGWVGLGHVADLQGLGLAMGQLVEVVRGQVSPPHHQVQRRADLLQLNTRRPAARLLQQRPETPPIPTSVPPLSVPQSLPLPVARLRSTMSKQLRGHMWLVGFSIPALLPKLKK